MPISEQETQSRDASIEPMPRLHEHRGGLPAVIGQAPHDEGLVKGSHHGDIENVSSCFGIQGPSPFARRGPFPSTVNLTCGRRSLAAAPRSRFRRAGLGKTRTILENGISGHGLLRFVYPGSARTDQVLGNDGITLVYSLGNLHRYAFDNDTGGHVFPERDQ